MPADGMFEAECHSCATAGSHRADDQQPERPKPPGSLHSQRRALHVTFHHYHHVGVVSGAAVAGGRGHRLVVVPPAAAGVLVRVPEGRVPTEKIVALREPAIVVRVDSGGRRLRRVHGF